MKNFLILVIIFLSSLTIISCTSANSEQLDGGPCDYQRYSGSAIIAEIVPAPSGDYNCANQPMRIKFIFIPDDSTASAKYRFNQWSDTCQYLRINAGCNPSFAWVDKNNIKAGNTYKCFRCEETKGSCTPVVFEFPEINLFPENGCN
jgi:hypothetical protein